MFLFTMLYHLMLFEHFKARKFGMGFVLQLILEQGFFLGFGSCRHSIIPVT